MRHEQFDYLNAFTRNIGWLTEEEQIFLRTKKVAIAGLGGVGGIHLLTLVRLGIEQFHLAEMDTFEIQNFNRQVGATLSSLHQPKIDVLIQMAKNINPNVEISCFNEGINQHNINEFLSGVDLYVDGLDFFVLDIRAQVFKRAYEMNIPAITAGPIGMGTCYLVMMPGQMTFEQYFQFNGYNPEELPVRFLVGLNPKLFNRHYLVDPSRVNFDLEKGPSTMIACQLCAGVMGAEALKILLHRGPIYALPRYHVFDPYLCKHRIGWMPWGNRHPVQRFKIFLMKKRLNSSSQEKDDLLPEHATTIEKILELARWAPSGDNSQPWRFTLVNSSQIRVVITNETPTNCYDFGGIPTLISGGFLLETLKIAASLFGLEIDYQYESHSSTQHQILVTFKKKLKLKPDPLAYCVKIRSVERGNYKRLKLADHVKGLLAESIGNEFDIIWLESISEKIAIAKLTMLATKLRMTMPELFAIHQHVFSPQNQANQGIPIAATGINPLTQMIMKWALKSWSRITTLNKLGAIQTNQLELDLLPSLFCGAHFFLIPKSSINGDEYYLKVGAAMQRFWLTVTQLGLVMQPNFAPLMFQYYADAQIQFSQLKSSQDIALNISKKLQALSHENPILFLGRIGYPQQKKTKLRSLRKSLGELFIKDTP
ncbi:ThiF family adenylyltransferase [Fluoribacter gormanii]|uniref:ThiF family adenylyltransferase n=1 Tax=Fluoribacter gormanii TaxID=464 RepID=UPI001040E637|nr:ThiF family adenylyltransferase [Fluoribacter gormanii]